MRTLLGSVAIGLGALLCQGAYAQDAASHTALCKDGTYFDGATHKGACRGHQGVKEWLDKSAASSTAAKTDAKSADTTAAADDTKATKKHRHKKDADATAASAATTAPAAATTSAAPAATTATTAATGAAAANTATHAKHTAPTPAKDIAQKPGGGPGLVWVNAESKVYHCNGDEWYGKTKQGSYMSVADAEKAGAHPAHGKACQ
ncbi:MAG: hypothetical protein QM741_00240 [Rudaea sp.]|uniref:hypothetical protein n=1 Tax=Rudaea sp. TaxID=2136325 RepID=UPI0039E6CCBF